MKIDLTINFDEFDNEATILMDDPIDSDNDNVDVAIKFKSGALYTATFFTIKNIESLFRKYKETGECGSGKYFYCTDMIIVEKLTPEVILETIKDLIKEGEFKAAFKLHERSE